MGRSSLRKKLFMGSLGLSSLLVLASGSIEPAPPHSPEVRYRILDLGVGVYPHGINSSGTVVGIASGRKVGTRAFVWRTETGSISPEVDDDALSFANDVSETGLVVGHVGSGPDSARAYSWMGRNPHLEFFPLEQGVSAAYGVNNAGHMVGRLGEGANSNPQAFYYEPAGGVRLLGTLGGGRSEATALNDRGEVVGWSTDADGESVAFIWREGDGMTRLGTLGGKRSSAEAVDSSGRAVGRAETSDGRTHAALFENGAVKDLGALGGDWSLASALNDSGVIVGQSQLPESIIPQFARKYFAQGLRLFSSAVPKDRSRATIWADEGPVDLTTLIDRNEGWDSLSAATGVNNLGQIVGFGRKHGHLRGFLLTPVDVEESDSVQTLAMNTDFLSSY